MSFPDVLGDVRAYLAGLLTPVEVVTRVPPNSTPRPPLVQVRRVGGLAEVPVRDGARLDVWAWHNSDPEAMALALDARRAIWALAGTNELGYPCYRVEEFLGPRQADDELTGIPRVWATYTLLVRADSAVIPAPLSS